MAGPSRLPGLTPSRPGTGLLDMLAAGPAATSSGKTGRDHPEGLPGQCGDSSSLTLEVRYAS